MSDSRLTRVPFTLRRWICYGAASSAYYFFFFYCYGDPRDLHSFPTRRSSDLRRGGAAHHRRADPRPAGLPGDHQRRARSEEHTSELQSRRDLVCRLLLEKKKNKRRTTSRRSNDPVPDIRRHNVENNCAPSSPD